MAFTTNQLATYLQNPNLGTWAASTLQNQAQYLPAFTAYFTAIQPWIDGHGGNGQPFGVSNVAGLTNSNGVQITLTTLAQRAVFDDAFNQTRQFLGTPGFRLFQSGAAFQHLITLLGQMG